MFNRLLVLCSVLFAVSAYGMEKLEDGSLKLSRDEALALGRALRHKDAQIAELQRERAAIERCVRLEVEESGLVLPCFGTINPRTGKPLEEQER